jgi:hypothetical protein
MRHTSCSVYRVYVYTVYLQYIYIYIYTYWLSGVARVDELGEPRLWIDHHPVSRKLGTTVYFN